jgi:predicted nuclease with TOPRIM domain
VDRLAAPSREEAGSSHAELQAIKPDVARLMGENAFYAQRVAELQQQNLALTEAATERARRVQDQDRELTSLYTELAALKPEAARLAGENAFYAQRLAELEQQNLALTEAATERAQRVQDQDRALTSLHTELATLKPELARLSGENTFYAQRHAELEEHNRLLTQAATAHAGRVQQQDRELTSLHTEIATLKPEVTRLTGENKSYAQRHVELEEHNRLLMQAATERAQRVQDLERRIWGGQGKQSGLDRPLACMLAPKTSGTALTVGICDVLPSTPRVHGWDRGSFGAFRHFESMSTELREQIYDSLPPAAGNDFVYGHMSYSTLVRGRPTARLMTVLREPRSRVLSLWMYWRGFSDEQLATAGAWGDVQRLARRPLAEFLSRPDAACQTDNIYVRRLLWPHPLIPDDGFIEPGSDERLLDEAAARLKVFDFSDVIENPLLEKNVRAFLVRPFVYRRMNETLLRPESASPVARHLIGEGLDLVEHRSRLDRQLWRAVASGRMAGTDVSALADEIFRKTIARYSSAAN